MINPFRNPRHALLFRIGYRVSSRVWRVQWAITRRVRQVVWNLRGKPIPEVGSIVEYGTNGYGDGPAKWRVNSYLRVAVRPDFSKDDWLSAILFDGCQRCGPEEERMQWCLPEEATHVSLAGVCGTIARIGEVKVVGMVQWSERMLQEERDHARRLGESHEMIF